MILNHSILHILSFDTPLPTPLKRLSALKTVKLRLQFDPILK